MMAATGTPLVYKTASTAVHYELVLEKGSDTNEFGVQTDPH